MDRPLEVTIGERIDPAAAIAHEMVVMFSAGADGLVARDA